MKKGESLNPHLNSESKARLPPQTSHFNLLTSKNSKQKACRKPPLALNFCGPRGNKKTGFIGRMNPVIIAILFITYIDRSFVKIGMIIPVDETMDIKK
ncbi:MAG TPA: hypothetical protein VHY08_20740 [Bacillota bacterium]|nr:hypothetical protein [Bacillota bacterium]